MRSARHGTPAVVRQRLIGATVSILAAEGIGGVTVTRVTERALVKRSAVRQAYGSLDQLILSTTLALTRGDVLPAAPAPWALDPSPSGTLGRLAQAHRAHVARSPARFAALLQLTSAAMFSTPAIRPLLTRRNAATRAAALSHLVALQRRGHIPDVDLRPVAGTFVDAMTGIEFCHLVDRDGPMRDAAYRELCESVARRVCRTQAG